MKTDRIQRRILWLLINPDTGRCRTETLPWIKLEPHKGQYDWRPLEEAALVYRNMGRSLLLAVETTAEDWVERGAEDYFSFLRALGERCRAIPGFYSLDMSVPCGRTWSREELAGLSETCREAFAFSRVMIPLSETELWEQMSDWERAGLILDSDRPVDETAERITAFGLQKKWEHAPVRLDGCRLGREILQNAVRWHISSITTTEDAEDIELASIGFRPEVRHCYTESEVRAGEKLPLKVWLVNTGNAPSYLNAFFKVRLLRTDADEEKVWKLSFPAGKLYPGEDYFLKEELPVEGLSQGEYDLQIGLFDDNSGYPVSIGIEGRISDGFYSTFLRVKVKEG